MKDRVLKLCRRLKNCTLEDLVQFTEAEKSVIETILLYLINEGKIQEKDGIYSFIEQTNPKNYIENKNLQIMFMYHSQETVDVIMRGFCAMLPTLKLSYLIDVSDSSIGDFYRIFRNLIYERQKNELLNYYVKSPQQYRYRKFFEKYAYFYTYENKIFVIQKPLRANKEKNFTKKEVQEFKKIYCHLARVESHNKFQTDLYQRLAEEIWRRDKTFEELYYDLKNNLIC